MMLRTGKGGMGKSGYSENGGFGWAHFQKPQGPTQDRTVQ